MPNEASSIELNGKTHALVDIERYERETARFVACAVKRHLADIQHVFEHDLDKPEDVGEDLTREALDTLGASKVGKRLYGKGDCKVSRFIFTPDDIIGQALLVDSKAEKDTSTITIEMTQTTLQVKQKRGDVTYNEQPQVPVVVQGEGSDLLTTTVFVKYVYDELEQAAQEGLFAVDGEPEKVRTLHEVVVVVLPSGALQEVYNPDAEHASIWKAGRNSIKRGERFRVRANLKALASHPGADPELDSSSWRVQRFPLTDTGKKRAEKFSKDVEATTKARAELKAAHKTEEMKKLMEQFEQTFPDAEQRELLLKALHKA